MAKRKARARRVLHSEQLESRLLLAPGDVIEFELQALDVNLNPLVNNTVQKGQDFVLAAFVSDIRRSPTGVFAGFLDVGFTNPDNFSVVYSETAL